MIATHRQSGERGYVLVTMTVAAVAMLGALGMAVDMGKLYITKSETQAFCDAASVAAALKLNGAASGITNAIAAVSATTNTWNFNTSTVSSPTVEFSILSTGPWVANPSPATGYIYARVKTAVTPSTFFVPVILKNFGQTVTYTQTVNSMAIAGQVPITSFPKGLAPYTVVSTNTVGPDFGLTKGLAYDMQWPQYNGTKNGCVPSDPTSDASNCFQNGSPPCAGDLASQTTMHAVAQYWGANINGYWGFSANSDIRDAILDVIQLQALNLGDNIAPVLSNGNKAAEAVYLDERSGQDHETTNVYTDYLASTVHNGRRLLPVPVVDPTSATSTTVIGYASFLLYSNGSNSDPTTNYYRHQTNGNDPFCAIYAGPYTFGSNDPSAATTGTGAYRVKLVE